MKLPRETRATLSIHKNVLLGAQKAGLHIRQTADRKNIEKQSEIRELFTLQRIERGEYAIKTS